MTEPEHGTYAGANAHNKRKEPMCAECRIAATAYQAAWRFRTGKLRLPPQCRECGSFFPLQHRCHLEVGNPLLTFGASGGGS